jgi:tetratricopeptide (TPR) repeat protein
MKIVKLTCLYLLGTVVCTTMFGQVSAKKYFKAGEEFLEAKKYSDAVNLFSRAISTDPNIDDAWFKRGLAYEGLQDYKNAAADYDRAIVYDPKNEEIYYHLGKAEYEQKQYDKAIVSLTKALKLEKKYLPAMQQKILTHLAINQVINALSLCDSAINIEKSGRNYFLQGLVLEKGNSAAKAEMAYMSAIKKEKGMLDAYIRLADIQIMSLNKPNEAMTNANEALKIAPNSIDALKVRSKVYLKKLDYPLAVNDISSAIVLAPENAALFFVRANYYLDYKQYQNAINDLNKVISLDPQNAEAFYKRAACYEEIGNVPLALKDYEALVKISEYDGKAQTLLKDAKARLFELNRETDVPELTLAQPVQKEKKVLEIPFNKNQITIKGTVNDKSSISFIKIKNKDVAFEKRNGQSEFTSEVAIDSTDSFIAVSVSDVYNNILADTFRISRTEINAPQVAIIAPVTSDNGEIYLDTNDPNIYIEGKITDESKIKSIMIDGMLASFKVDEMNPTFSVNLPISNKSKIDVTATDIYGNEKTYTYKLNREGADLLAANPMGKTWVVFIENSNYQTFASLEGPTKDVSLMKNVLTKYQVNNIISRKDMTKGQMEKFFSIELRDLIRSNHVNTILVWYAGHGKYINETGYWIPVDAKRDDEFTYFNINVLRAAFQSYPSTLNHTLVVTDACESGPSFYQAMRSDIKERACTDWQASRMKSSQVFSSAGYELAKDNSEFTKTFANMLQSNPNACIPIESIVLKVTNAVSQGNKQKPKFGKISGLTDEDGTFFFIAK